MFSIFNTDFFNDVATTEILFQSYNQIWIEVNGEIKLTSFSFENEIEYNNFLHSIFSEARLRPNIETPCVDGSWRDFRVHFIQDPVAQPRACLTLRRKTSHHFDMQYLTEKEWASAPALDWLKKEFSQKKSFLIIGATGSGKTSALSALLHLVKSNERVILIEDTDEILLPNSVSVKLLTRQIRSTEMLCYDQGDLVKQSLRMRPDRLILGEVRGPEAKDLLLAYSSGHKGGLASLHAENDRQALLRLEMLVQMGAPQWSLQTVRALIYSSFDYILKVEHKNKKRQLASITKLCHLEEKSIGLEKIFCSEKGFV